MADIIAEIVSSLTNREPVVIATIIASSGSTPLPTGAILLLKDQGNVMLGTIGGGSFEADAARDARQMFTQGGSAAVRRFELSDSESEDGMICGGNVDVLIERLGEDELPVFSRLLGVRDEGSDCTLLRAVDAREGTVKRSVVEGTSDVVIQDLPLQGFLNELGISPDRFIQSLQRAHRDEAVERVSGSHGETILQPIIGIQPLIIFGAGHIGFSLSKIAAVAGFSVTVVDDRREYAQPSRFPAASRVLAESFERAFEQLRVRASTSIVIVTRGHDSDREVLSRAVRTPARYIGMIGSRKKVAATFARLQAEGVPLPSIQRVRAPIGLEIGAVTAEEISVSIVAELIRARRGMVSAPEPLSRRMDQWFIQSERGIPKKPQE